MDPGGDGAAARASLTRPGLTAGRALLITALALLLHVGRLSGPFTDGQNGNCGAMFALFERNAKALGVIATRGVPVVNPVPPADIEGAEFYSHHPPGLPWLVMLAGRAPLPIEPASRIVALLASLASALLLADLATRLAGRHAGLAAAALLLALPAGLHHGTLVNYETVAMPALLALLRALLLERPRTWVVAALAALTDYVALMPLLFAARFPPRRAWVKACLAAGAMLAACMLLARWAQPEAVGDVLAQGLGVTFLAPDFDAGAWLAALRAHVAALYGWALLPAAVALVLLPRRGALLRRALLVLLAVGVLNVTLFARHATGHEHFSLLLLPFVALATATLFFPREQAARPPTAVGAVLLVVLLTLSASRYREAAPARATTRQAELADALRATGAGEAIYVRPDGAPFVFLHRAGRHVVPDEVASLAEARAAAEDWRERFGLPESWPAYVIQPVGAPAPAWLAALPGAASRGALRFTPLPPGR